jgi:hypothetical protein
MTFADDIEGLAASGNDEALTELGKIAIEGRANARTPDDGARLLVQAAEKGGAEADAIVSLVVAADAKDMKDWSLALQYLQRSAERGWQPARDQLRVLAADRDLARSVADGRFDARSWRRLRESIDIARLLAPPAMAKVSGGPRIGVLENFATADECKWMIARGATRMGRAALFDQVRGGDYEDNSRTNSAMLLGFLETDFVFTAVRARIAAATQLARKSFEQANVLHYAAGQEFTRHFDFYDPSKEANAALIAARGQRIATFLIYLNDAFTGAETEFAAIDWKYRGRPGDALFFMNVDEAGQPDRRTMHAGLPPASGEKWLFSQWIRGVPGAGL